ncbi:serine hydrolase domain-containing protein [Bacteroidota bacterium]
MKKSLYFLLLIPLICLSSCKKKSDPPPYDYTPELKAMLNAKWNEFWAGKENPIGGLMMKVSSPLGDYFTSVNFNDSVNEHFYFRGASNTKTFTAAAIMLLSQQGKLNIDDVVTDLIPGTTDPYLPATPTYDIPFKDEITLRLLLQHRAGVFDLVNDKVPDTVNAPYAGMQYSVYIIDILGDTLHTYTYDEWASILSIHHLTYFAPDSAFHYSDIGYSLLGLIVERVSGMPVEDYFNLHFLDPNGLNETTFPSLGTIYWLPDPYVKGYFWTCGQTTETTYWSNPSEHVAEGNVITTNYDLNLWVKRLIRGEAGLSRATVDEMMDVLETHEIHQYYGLGLVYTPGLGYGHNGATAGYFSVMRYNPETQVSFTIIASFWDLADLKGENDLLYNIGHEANKILGYE